MCESEEFTGVVHPDDLLRVHTLLADAGMSYTVRAYGPEDFRRPDGDPAGVPILTVEVVDGDPVEVQEDDLGVVLRFQDGGALWWSEEEGWRIL